MTDNTDPSSSNYIHTDRATIERSLGKITAQLNSALIHAGVVYPVYMCIPASGNALLTVACPVDPSDDDWEQITHIACDILGLVLDKKLSSRRLSCAMAGTAMGAADLTTE